MSFLDKFKGRTNQLSHHHIDNIFPNHHPTIYPPHLPQNTQQTDSHAKPQNMAKTTAVKHISKNKQQ
jgi:hypothetical protein